MNRVLVVANNAALRDNLALALFEDGHRIKTASSGREAVNRGCRFRPDVVVSAWRLDRNLTGLDVSDAVRGMVPALQTILFTAYPSEDMEQQARRRGVFRYFAGPLDPIRLREAVHQAFESPAPTESGSRIPILEVDANQAIVYANEPARIFLASTDAGETCTRLDDHFLESIDLEAARNDWIEVHPVAGARRTPWYLAAPRGSDDRTSLVLLHAASDRMLRSTAVVRTLLDHSSPEGTARLLHPYHILIVDDDAFVRRTTAASLASAGAFCHTAANHEEARRLFAADPEIQFVLLDHDMPEGPPRALVDTFRQERPEVVLIGNSGQPRQEEFESMGIHHYLTKPWSLEDFLDQIHV